MRSKRFGLAVLLTLACGIVLLAVARGALASAGASGLAAMALLPGALFAHCDTESGPVAVAARKALKTGEFSHVQIWVGQGQEEELRDAFGRCLPLYRADEKAKDLAARYFTERAVRLHRAAEGMSYDGLKPARPLPPDVAAAEEALETGRLEVVTDLLGQRMEAEVGELFAKAREARQHRDEGVAAGRRYVDAYVRYVIYVHGLHGAIAAGPAHGVGEHP